MERRKRTTGSIEAGTKETVKELIKSESEKQKDSERQAAKTLYEEANETLAQAIQNMNFNEAAVAQGLLELSRKKEESDGKCNGPKQTLFK